ncbi:MAG: YHS domain-containing (seleno)protein [Cytophagales bacterium]
MKKIAFSFLILMSFISYTQETKPQRLKNYNIDKTLAIQGYDPVTYFVGKPQVGKSEYSVVYEGVTYRFSTKENMDIFKSNPTKYEPAYGGWCAYAMGSNGEKVEIDPETYKIVNGKNYLFYNKFFTNTLPDWNKMEAVLMKKADDNWSKINK